MGTILDPALFLATPEVVLLLVPLSLIAVYLHQKFSEFPARSAGRPLPPGPPGIPILGNLFALPKISPWIGYRELSRKYGALLRTSIFALKLSATKMLNLIRRQFGLPAGLGALHPPYQRRADRVRPPGKAVRDQLFPHSVDCGGNVSMRGSCL